jgi:hypothetical protein
MPLFASIDNLKICYDVRRIAEYVQDNSDGAETPAKANALIAAATDLLTELGYQASDYITSAATVRNAYSEQDLVNIAGSTGGGGPMLRRIACDLWYGLLVARRGYSADDLGRLAPKYAEALKTCELLRNGDRVFSSVPGMDTAGLPTEVNTVPIPGINPPTMVQGAFRILGFGPQTTPNPYWPG